MRLSSGDTYGRVLFGCEDHVNVIDQFIRVTLTAGVLVLALGSLQRLTTVDPSRHRTCTPAPSA
jgi:hypothetical protein